MKKWFVLGIIFFLVIAIGWFAYFHRGQVETPTVSVTKGTIVEYAEAVGYIKPRHAITIKSQVDGTIEEIYHYEGEYVTLGTPLVKVKPTPTPADYAAAHQQVDESKAVEEAERINLERLKSEIKQGLVNKTYVDYTNTKRNYEAAKTKRILAEQKLALLDVGKTNVAGKPIANIVTSPIDGYILNRNINVGDPVLSIGSYQSSTILFSAADMKDLMFEGLVDEMDAVKVKEKMPARIKVGTMPDEMIMGTVNKVSLQSEKENMSQGGQNSNINAPFNVGFKIQITNLKFPTNLILRSGYSATAEVAIGKAENVLLLPARVIRFKGDDQYVLLPAVNKNKPQERLIKTGIADGVRVEIKSGLQLGDRVLDQPEKATTDDD